MLTGPRSQPLFSRPSAGARGTAPGLRRRAFSLVEAVVAAGIVGLMVVASMNLLGGAVRTRIVDNDKRTALMLAHQLMTEIQQQPYKDPTPLNLTFGVEPGESSATRADFDDVDDYNLYQEKPPHFKDGTMVTGYDAWKRNVKVTWVQPGTLTSSLVDTGLELIEVDVTDPSNRVTIVSALRSNYTAADAPPSGTTALSWTGIELEAGGDTPRRSTGGVNSVGQPVTVP